jgi:hypothetical protein
MEVFRGRCPNLLNFVLRLFRSTIEGAARRCLSRNNCQWAAKHHLWVRTLVMANTWTYLARYSVRAPIHFTSCTPKDTYQVKETRLVSIHLLSTFWIQRIWSRAQLLLDRMRGMSNIIAILEDRHHISRLSYSYKNNSSVDGSPPRPWLAFRLSRNASRVGPGKFPTSIMTIEMSTQICTWYRLRAFT